MNVPLHCNVQAIYNAFRYTFDVPRLIVLRLWGARNNSIAFPSELAMEPAHQHVGRTRDFHGNATSLDETLGRARE